MSTIKKYMKIPLDKVREEMFDDDVEMKRAIDTLAEQIYKNSAYTKTNAKKVAIGILLGYQRPYELQDSLNDGGVRFWQISAIETKEQDEAHKRDEYECKRRIRTYFPDYKVADKRLW